MRRKIKIEFVCLGNICRSPMAEFVFRKMADEAGVGEWFEVSSSATSREEEGNPVYPPAARKLREKGIDCSGKYARRPTVADMLRKHGVQPDAGGRAPLPTI